MFETSRPPSPALRLAPLGLLIATGIAFVGLGGGHYLTFAALAEHGAWLCGLVRRSEILAVPAFIALYAGLTALSLPVAGIMTIVAGFLFGTWLGLASALIGATIGATALFFAARAGLAGLAGRGGPRLRRLERGFRADAANYLLVLRLVPIFPFWLINLVAGMAGMRPRTFVLATFFGMIPACFVYAGIGDGLGNVIAEGRTPDVAVLCRPRVLLPLIGLAALALLPVLYKCWRARRDRQPA
jgi:uncharacterized membrane protein YdjX (TVP38/TMEM64 family)